MGTKNNPGEFDCYEVAAPDEPMFILLARDGSAPGRVEEWALNRFVRLIEEFRVPYPERDSFAHKEKTLRTLRKISEALQCADNMKAWRARELVRERQQEESWTLSAKHVRAADEELAGFQYRVSGMPRRAGACTRLGLCGTDHGTCNGTPRQ